MKLIILRHGEAEDDIRNSYGGIADDVLTEKGRSQAEALARKLSDYNVQLILSSPLARAKETAEIISEKLGGTELLVWQGLKERNSYGVLSGVNKDLAKKIFSEILSPLKEKPGYSREPILGAEDFDQFVQRVHLTFREIIKYLSEHKIETAILVSHGTFTRGLFEQVLGLGDIKLEPSDIAIVDYIPAVIEYEMLTTT